MRRAVATMIGCLLGAVSVCAQDRPITVIFDEHMTTAAGTRDVLTAQRALASLEDRWIPNRFTEDSTATQIAGAAYRLGKWLTFDLPQDIFLMDVVHEVFGHGSRLRELGVRNIHYGFNLPLPYGNGGAVTSFDGGSIAAATRADLISIDTAGVEGQQVLADHIAAEALLRRRWSYRDAWLYLQSRVAGLLYIEGVSANSGPGNDVADFLHDFNQGCVSPMCTTLTPSVLKHRAWFMVADPLLASAAYGLAIGYIERGQSRSPVAMIPLTNRIKYLPTAGFAMAPYGSEWRTDQYFVTADRLLRVTVRVGDSGATHPLGAGVQLTRMLSREWLDAGLVAHVWRQPPQDAPPTATRLDAGALAAATIDVPLGRRSVSRAAITAEIGYKSTGYVAGEPQRSGPIVRIGLSLALPER